MRAHTWKNNGRNGTWYGKPADIHNIKPQHAQTALALKIRTGSDPSVLVKYCCTENFVEFSLGENSIFFDFVSGYNLSTISWPVIYSLPPIRPSLLVTPFFTISRAKLVKIDIIRQGPDPRLDPLISNHLIKVKEILFLIAIYLIAWPDLE